MKRFANFSKHDDVAVITVDNPPVNALSPGVAEDIHDAIQRAAADPDIRALILTGSGRTFIAGGDIRHLEIPKSPVGQVWRDEMERLDKPVVAAIHGFALGGGLECALCCHYRIATPSARVGLPEVRIGIVPGGGGTQRLPRLIGVGAALDLIVSGRHVTAAEAMQLGILDAIIDDDDLHEGALTFARKIAAERPIPRTGAMVKKLGDPTANAALFTAMRERIAWRARNQLAPHHCIACVEAAVNLPLVEGLARERDLFEELCRSEESRALKHVFWAERHCSAPPARSFSGALRSIGSAAVVGAGAMGAGIAMVFADAGIPVTLSDRDPAGLERALARIRERYQRGVARGALRQSMVDERLSLIHSAAGIDELTEADIVVEAVPEDIEIKRAVLRTIDSVAKPGCIIASNISSLDIDSLSQATARPHDVVGMHFFSPVQAMALLEIVRGSATSQEVLATVVGLARALGKIPVVSGNCEGFIANRSKVPFEDELMALTEEGAMPEQVDEVMLGFGFPMGPFAALDLAGLDVVCAARRQRLLAGRSRVRSDSITDALVDRGRCGQKTGAGYYRYGADGRTPHVDPDVTALIRDVSRHLGIERRRVPDEEIRDRLLLAAVNESARIVDEGIARGAADIDVVWINGFGFPRYRGGLMYWAEHTLGWSRIVNKLDAWHDRFGGHWAPAEMLRRAAGRE